MKHSTQLVVFCRLPVPGKVKTRLAASIGHATACELYKTCAEHILKVAASCPVQLTVFYSFGDEATKVQEWVHGVIQQDTVHVLPQLSSPDLGHKMEHALSWALSTPGCSKVIIIGTDIPDITGELVERAVCALDSHEVVVGPARDGGYYLLGLTRVHSALFQDIPWSTSSVLHTTVRKAAEAGLSLAPLDTLPTLIDIDTIHDLKAWAAQHRQRSSPPAADAAAAANPSNQCLLATDECGTTSSFCPLREPTKPDQHFATWLFQFVGTLNPDLGP